MVKKNLAGDIIQQTAIATPLTLFPGYVTSASKPSRKDHLTFKANREQGRHGWLRLTPAYSVHLVHDLIAQCDPDALILDPFCGTGTTALVAAQLGRRCHTLDINPFLVWLANAKCATYSADDIDAAEAIIHTIVAELRHNEKDGALGELYWTPPIKDIHKWWDAQTLHALAYSFDGLQHAPGNQQVRDLLLVSFCRVAIETAAVSFGHQSMSFKKPKSSLATHALFEETAVERVADRLLCASADVLCSAREAVGAGAAKSGVNHLGRAFLGDARQVVESLPGIPEVRYTTVITSPPYPNRMSYIRELRPYMYWLGYLTSGRAAGELDWQAIGGTWGCATSNLTHWEPPIRVDIPDPTFLATVARISQHSRLLGTYVAKYFYDVLLHVQSLKPALAPGANVHYIVGNSRFYDVTLDTERLYAAILAAEGFHTVSIEPLRKRTSKKDLYEFVVSATAP